MGRRTRPYLLVRVSFTDDAGNTESLTSEVFGPAYPAPPGDCPGADSAPTPTAVEVEAVPIVVESTTEEYFVLYALLDLDSPNAYLRKPSEVPVSVTLGQDGTTTLLEQLSALPTENYRVEKYLIADPADVDRDCIDDIAELQDPAEVNPLNPAPAVPSDDGAVAIPDRETFEALASDMGETSVNSHLVGLESLNFIIFGLHTARPAVYFIDHNNPHHLFIQKNNVHSNPLFWEGMSLRGAIVYHPNVIAPNGYLGVYLYHFAPLLAPRFKDAALTLEALAANMPLLDNNLAYHPLWPSAQRAYGDERARYEDSRVSVLLEVDILRDVDFIPFNREEGYGFLRVMSLEERPNPRDIVIYETLPNELPRVAGIITTVPQTPLSHVNLRALQDGVPNAFIRDALNDADIDDLISSYVHYTVTEDGYSIRAATRAEVDAHHAASRPDQTHTPERDLTITQITDLDDIGFDDWDLFGVKAANLAVLRTLRFPEGTVPDGGRGALLLLRRVHEAQRVL